MVGTGETLADARTSYTKLLFNMTDLTTLPSGDIQTLTGIVSRIGLSQVDGTTTYTIMLEGHPELILTGSTSLSAKLPIMVVGDEVSIEYINSNTLIRSLTSFDNLSCTK